MRVKIKTEGEVFVPWNTIVCALRKDLGVILAQLPLYKPTPGHGSRGIKIQGQFPVGFRQPQGFRTGGRIMSGDASHDHVMSCSLNYNSGGEELKQTKNLTKPLMFWFIRLQIS